MQNTKKYALLFSKRKGKPPMALQSEKPLDSADWKMSGSFFRRISHTGREQGRIYMGMGTPIYILPCSLAPTRGEMITRVSLIGMFQSATPMRALLCPGL